MGQIAQTRADQLWPQKSDRIVFLCHTKDGGSALRRCLESVEPLHPHASVILVDDRTKDDSIKIAARFPRTHVRYFTWDHSFSSAKNRCLQKAMDLSKLRYGDWVLFMGDDFELQPHTIPEILEFVKDETNFFAQFWVPEYSPPPSSMARRILNSFGLFREKVVSRRRKLLWRHHPQIFWEKSVHEEAVYSAYRLTGQGLTFGGPDWKDFPVLGGRNGMIHYGYHEDGGENGEYFLWKKNYYLVLGQIDSVRYKLNEPETEEGRRKALCKILNREVSRIDTWSEIELLVARYCAGDHPPGLAAFVERLKEFPNEYEL